MNRRGFIAGLLGLPAAAVVASKVATEPEPTEYMMGNWGADTTNHGSNIYHFTENRWTVSSWDKMEECLGPYPNELHSSNQ